MIISRKDKLSKIIVNKVKKRSESKNMANVNWTEEQLQAIETKGSNLLIAAAARKRENSSIS